MMRKLSREWFECCKKKVNKMEEIKLKKCPCCGGETKFEYGQDFITKQVRAKCSKCGLATKWVDESVDYCAKEEAAKVWNKRYVETNQGDFGGITVDELERALKKMEQEFNARKIMKEEKTPKCPICGEGGLHILTLSYLSDKARAQIHCDMCGTDIDIPDTSKCIGEMSELVHNEK